MFVSLRSCSASTRSVTSLAVSCPVQAGAISVEDGRCILGGTIWPTMEVGLSSPSSSASLSSLPSSPPASPPQADYCFAAAPAPRVPSRPAAAPPATVAPPDAAADAPPPHPPPATVVMLPLPPAPAAAPPRQLRAPRHGTGSQAPGWRQQGAAVLGRAKGFLGLKSWVPFRAAWRRVGGFTGFMIMFRPWLSGFQRRRGT